MTTTSILRQQLKSKRSQLAPQHVDYASRRVIEQLYALSCVKNASTLALYLPIHNEIDLSAMLSNPQFQYCLPRVVGQQIEMREYSGQQSLVRSKWGIDEPSPETQVIAGSEIDVLIMPLVGYSKRGDRIGMGGGFYDRYLENRQRSRPLCIGVAYQWQCAKFDPEPWDQPLDIVVTEQQVTRFNRHKQKGR